MQVTEQTEIIRRVRAAGFDAIDVSGPLHVTVTQGECHAVSVSGSPEAVEQVVTEVDGTTLKLSVRCCPARAFISDCVPVEIGVTLPDLVALHLGGMAQAELNELALPHEVRIRLSGASRARAALQVARAVVGASGASRLAMEGSGRDLVIDCSGASQLDCAHFTAEDVRADLSGASNVRLLATGKLAFAASGASHLKVAGAPRMERSALSGASSIQADQAAQ